MKKVTEAITKVNGKKFTMGPASVMICKLSEYVQLHVCVTRADYYQLIDGCICGILYSHSSPLKETLKVSNRVAS